MKNKLALITIAALIVAVNAQANYSCYLTEETDKGSNQFNKLVDSKPNIDLSGPDGKLIFSRPDHAIFASSSVDGNFWLMSVADTKMVAMASGNGDRLTLLDGPFGLVISCVK